MRLDSVFAHLATVAVCATLFPKALAQVCDCQGAVAILYDGSPDCDPVYRKKACTWMYPNRCCTGTSYYPPAPVYNYYHSASMYGIENLPDGDAGWSIGTSVAACRRVIVHHGNGCLNTGGEKTVTDAGWDFCKDRPEVCPEPASGTNASKARGPYPADGEKSGGCRDSVSPDVWFISETPGQPGAPFSEGAILRLNNAFGDEVVDLKTLTVKEGRLSDFRAFAEMHGDGLSREQVRAMKVVAEEDSKRGTLTSVMAKYLQEDTSLTGKGRRCRAHAEL